MQLTRFVILFLGLLVSYLPSFPQSGGYGSFQELYHDVNSRDYHEAIPFMEDFLSLMENHPNNQFQDSTYIGMTTCLATAYIQNNQPYLADSLLSHSINYMTEMKRTSDLLYLLYTAYGGLYSFLQNYNLASTYIESAIQLYNETNLIKGETYALMLSMLATCHGQLNNLHKAYFEIEEAVNIIENSESEISAENKISIFQKAGSMYYELKMPSKAELMIRKAYVLSKSSNSISNIISTTLNLAIFEQNRDRYKESIVYLKELEQMPLTVNDRVNLYGLLYTAYHVLNNEEETVKYAQMFSQAIIDSSCSSFASFPLTIIEDYWEEYSSQLMGIMGILYKYSSNRIVREMCYNNALFIKNLSFVSMDAIRTVSSNNEDIAKKVSDINNIKTDLFGGKSSLHDELYQREQLLIRQIREETDYTNKTKVYLWNEVKQSLRLGECAIEIVPYIGLNENNDDVLPQKYGALILLPEEDSPQFIELCTYDQLREIVVNSFSEQEFGISQLYRKGSECLLYRLIWEKIEPYLKNVKTIYLSPVYDMLNINFGFVPCPDNKYVNEKYNIRLVSSTSVVCKPKMTNNYSDVVIYGGIEFTKNEMIKDEDSLRGITLRGLEDNSRGALGMSHELCQAL